MNGKILSGTNWAFVYDNKIWQTFYPFVEKGMHVFVFVLKIEEQKMEDSELSKLTKN